MKNYCVHVYPQVLEFDNIKAKNEKQAEQKVVNEQYVGNYEDIMRIEVLIQGDECGTDNELKNKKCVECGEKL